jgi:hypothetical protein
MFQTNHFTYVHMQKTGGTRIREILSELTDGQSLGRRHGFLHRKPDDHLVFGSIRDPWAWYVSLWAFGCEGRGGVLSWLKDDPDWVRLYSNVNDVELFRQWLRRVYDERYTSQMHNSYGRFSLRGRVGFMTYRYAYLYLPGFDLENSPPFEAYHYFEDYDHQYNMVDAWIELERLTFTLGAALKLAGYDVDDDRLAQLCETCSNTSNHLPVWEYYDSESWQLVHDRERLIVEKHGYN